MTEQRLTLLDDILNDWREVIGEDFDGYRNHCQRMVHCCLALRDCSEVERQKLMIAAAFHDIGIWTAHTLDYLPPSVTPAMAYLKDKGLEAWSEEIRLMITEHHKLSPWGWCASVCRAALCANSNRLSPMPVSTGGCCNWHRTGLCGIR